MIECDPKIVTLRNNTPSYFLVIGEKIIEEPFWKSGCFRYISLFDKEIPIAPYEEIQYEVAFNRSRDICSEQFEITTTIQKILISVEGKYFLW